MISTYRLLNYEWGTATPSHLQSIQFARWCIRLCDNETDVVRFMLMLMYFDLLCKVFAARLCICGWILLWLWGKMTEISVWHEPSMSPAYYISSYGVTKPAQSLSFDVHINLIHSINTPTSRWHVYNFMIADRLIIIVNQIVIIIGISCHECIHHHCVLTSNDYAKVRCLG